MASQDLYDLHNLPQSPTAWLGTLRAWIWSSRAWLGPPSTWLGPPWAWLRPLGGGWTDGWMDGRNFSPFYRISSPIGTAALLHIHVNYQKLKQGKGTADHMMPLGDWLLNEH